MLDSRTGRLAPTLKRFGLGSLRERMPNSRMGMRGRRDCSRALTEEESCRSFPARRGDIVVGGEVDRIGLGCSNGVGVGKFLVAE